MNKPFSKLSPQATEIWNRFSRKVRKLLPQQSDNANHTIAALLPTFLGAVSQFGELRELENEVAQKRFLKNMETWTTATIEFLSRLLNDWVVIREKLHLTSASPVPIAVWRAGDPHNGRTVLIMKFRNGEMLVYKPTSQHSFIQFQNLKGWLNKIGNHPELYIAKAVDCCDYGWIEFVPYETCESHGKVQNFYRRSATILVLLQMLQATDIHFQNVVAFGEYPIVVDLETLFQPRLLSESQQESHPELEKTLTDSVTRVGLLPRPDSTRNTDISALGSPAKLKAAINSPFQRPYTSHRPTLGGKNVSLLEYRDEFCSQFSETYRAILENRDKLILDESPIHGFESAKIRVVVRPSLEYANVLQSKSNSERNELIAKLKADASSRRFLSPLIEDELRQLGEFDIPYFYTTPDSTDLRSPIGTTFHNFLEKPGIEVAKKRISNTSISDLHLQLEIINNSISKHSLS